MILLISQKNIDDSELPTCRYCPAENAMISAGFNRIVVGENIAFGWRGDKFSKFNLSKELQEQISNFDNNKAPFVAGEYQMDEI